MEEKKKNNSPKPKFNPYWIYGVIITLLLGMSMFGGDNSFQSVNKTNISEFERFLNDGDVSEIIVINKNLAILGSMYSVGWTIGHTMRVFTVSTRG